MWPEAQILHASYTHTHTMHTIPTICTCIDTYTSHMPTDTTYTTHPIHMPTDTTPTTHVHICHHISHMLQHIIHTCPYTYIIHIPYMLHTSHHMCTTHTHTCHTDIKHTPHTHLHHTHALHKLTHTPTAVLQPASTNLSNKNNKRMLVWLATLFGV